MSVTYVTVAFGCALSDICVSTFACVSHANGALSTLPLALRLWGDTHCSLCQAQMSIHSSTPLSLNPAQGSFAYWVCVRECVCVCTRARACLPCPETNRGATVVDSMHMHYYGSTGDLAAKLIRVCVNSGTALSKAWWLITFAVSTHTQSFSLGWFILYAKQRTFSKLTECFVQYNLSDHAKQSGTRGKMWRRKKKKIQMQNREKSHHRGWLQRRDENSRGKMAFSISPSLPSPPSLDFSLSLDSLCWYTQYLLPEWAPCTPALLECTHWRI